MKLQLHAKQCAAVVAGGGSPKFIKLTLRSCECNCFMRSRHGARERGDCGFCARATVGF